jgi:hypothetical protein
MPFFPPLTAMLSSASSDLAKTWLDLKGWPATFELLQRHNLAPTSGWGRQASALGLIILNGFIDWYHAEDTPVARFMKDILRDIPSEAMSRMWGTGTTSPTPRYNPILNLEPDERKKLLVCMRSLDTDAQKQMRIILSKLQGPELQAMAATDATDMATLLDLLMPPALPSTLGRPGNRFTASLHRLADFLAPGMGR